MTSQINPNNIDGNYPVAGIPNNTQGMRNNFTETRTNFQYARDEITELQNKVVLKQALTGGTLDNDMNDNVLRRVVLQDFAYTLVNIPATSGTITLDYAAGSYQQINPTGACSLAFANLPPAGQIGTLFFGFNVTNLAQTLTFPASVSQGLFGIEGISPGTPGATNTITFGQVNNFTFELITPDGGVTFYLYDLSRPRNRFFGNVVIDNAAAATSTVTGALVVDGGVGIGGNLHVGGQIVGNITVTGVSVVGNVTGGNIITSGTVLGNIDSENIAANNVSVTTLTAQDSTTISVESETSFYEQVFVDADMIVTGNVTVAGNISAATTTRIGGVRAGPGANISNTGLLTIDSANLSFSFGNFTASNNILTIVNSDENMILETQGNAEIQMVGNIGFYKSNGIPPDPNNRFFFARDDGQLRILVPVEDPLEGGVEIIGSATGNFVTPGAPGAMLHLTGNPNIACRLYHDTLGNYSSYVARRYNGNTASPGQVLAGEDVFRINTTAATDAGMGNVAMCQISFTALENQTTTAQGSSITFTVTPVGSPASSRVDVATITVANGMSATQFTTAGTVSATGNVVGGNVQTAGSVLSSGTAGVGYTTGAGGTVTQLTDKTTAVTLNTISGEITTSNANLNGDTSVTFTLTNSAIAATDVMIINHVSGGTIGKYTFNASCAAGSASITIHNVNSGGGAAEAAALVLRFAVIKAAVA